MNPLFSLGVCDIALRAQDDAIGIRVLERFQDAFDLGLREFLMRFLAPADENLVGVMAVVVMVMMVVRMLVLILVVMMVMAGAVRVVALLILVVIMVVMVMLMPVFLIVVIVMMVMRMRMFILIFLIVVVVMVAGAVRIVALVVLVMVMMMVVRLFFELCKLDGDGAALLHGLHQLLAGELRPRGRDDHGVLVVLADHGDALVELFFLHAVGAAEDDGVGRLDLVVVELAEVLHIHLALRRVRHGHEITKLHVVGRNLAHGADDVGQLADAGRLDQNTIRCIVCNDLLERAAEIAHQRAADAAGVHLRDLNARLLQKAAVNADLAEFVLNEDNFLAVIGFPDHLFDKRCLASAKETGININFCHTGTPSSCIILLN